MVRALSKKIEGLRPPTEDLFLVLCPFRGNSEDNEADVIVNNDTIEVCSPTSFNETLQF